jgi:superfamily II DNA helicase RecQ
MRPTRALTMTEELRRLMRQLFGENMTFRSPEQAEALIAVVRKEGPIVVVLPTGGGKSLLFMLPSLLLLAHITIVVTPFVALQHDLVQ